ncbi:hypothetical protein ACFSM5_07810 [Lacibacterium aquatile]|uniref:Uncharacterized protein n=1 Tax=Lacibacterium aquatile TaxID=1168082 RepID=A0ABW5DPV8_9PROT
MALTNLCVLAWCGASAADGKLIRIDAVPLPRYVGTGYQIHALTKFTGAAALDRFQKAWSFSPKHPCYLVGTRQDLQALELARLQLGQSVLTGPSDKYRTVVFWESRTALPPLIIDLESLGVGLGMQQRIPAGDWSVPLFRGASVLAGIAATQDASHHRNSLRNTVKHLNKFDFFTPPPPRRPP